jgi:hypothetical protein
MITVAQLIANTFNKTIHVHWKTAFHNAAFVATALSMFPCFFPPPLLLSYICDWRVPQLLILVKNTVA